MTIRIRAMRRLQLIPGIEGLMVEESERGSHTMQASLHALIEAGTIGVGDRIVAISGSPKAISGATSTIRLFKIAEDGSIHGAE